MNQMQIERLPEVFFLSMQHGPCFCLFHEPQGIAMRGSILYFHPFAEELNTTRRIVAHQARNLARLGYGVLQVDLFGCGDSGGNFEQATWAKWLDMMQEAYQWLKNDSSYPIWFWGLRGGCLLASALLSRIQEDTTDSPVHLLLWQPATNGQQMLQQFLRIREAGEWIGTRNTNQVPAAQIWAQGKCVEVAGYSISPDLANDLSKAKLTPVTAIPESKLLWIELSTNTSIGISPASQRTLAQWGAAGWQVQSKVVCSPSFWQNIGTDNASDLWSATNAAMASPFKKTHAESFKA